MNILLLKGFNNYFNRIVKKYSTIADYQSNSTSYVSFSGINFNPNDGVATELIIGSTTQQENSKPLDWENLGTPDYLVCYEMEGNPAAPVIKSRWFVLESERTRKGQYRVALKRDVIAEHFDQIMTAPCFVEKGVINNNSDPLLFNNENMSFNQIKQSELLLKDQTKCAWIVGYVSQDKNRYPTSGYYESTSPVATYEEYSSVPEEIIRLAGVGTFQRPVAKDTTSWGVAAGRCSIKMNWNCLKDPLRYQEISFTNVPWTGEISFTSPSTTDVTSHGYLYGAWGAEQVVTANTVPSTGAIAFTQALRSNSTLRNYYVQNILTNGEDFSETVQEQIEAWNGRYFKQNGKIYQIKYEQVGGRIMGPAWSINGGTTYATAVTTVFNNTVTSAGGTFFSGDANNISSAYMRLAGPSNGVKFCELSWEYYSARISFVEVPLDAGDKIKTYIPAGRIQACDTPMDVFAIPFSDNFRIYTGVDAETGDPDPTTLITMSKQAALQAAVSIAQAGDNLYDIQILPYFPNPDMAEYMQNETIVVPDAPFTADVHYNYFYNTSDAPIGIIFWSRTSVFSVDLDYQVSLDNTNALTLKKSNELDLYRLTSPNYAGSFEFSLAKSGGRINKFNADCTYKPYSPYIHVTPDLAGLYGENFSAIDDARGLICGGDFSITKIVNQWQQYELQNKNYQAIFDRQIQNMDVNNKIAMEQQDWKNMQGVLGGILGGGMGGAIGGLKSAGPYGAIAGAVAGTAYGTAMSEIGAIKQTDWLQRQQAEAKDYTMDMYGYKLGNIQALPNSLSKTTALTNNNKLFPFVEYFTATAVEKDAYDAKIRYNGMTIMKIDNLNNYSVSSDYDKVYVKGQLIRLDNINDDFHVADAIYQEVNKGFFVEQ